MSTRRTVHSHPAGQPMPNHDWNERYEQGDLPWDSAEPDDHLVQFVRDRKLAHGRALDVGCGTGTNALWLAEQGFDVALYHVKPNQLKSMWWGEDARLVREDLFGSLRARQAAPRARPLVQLLIFDEIDSLQKRGGGERHVSSSSHSDALEALLVEMQGLAAGSSAQGGPPAHLLWRTASEHGTSAAMGNTLLTERDGALVVLTLNRPDKLNALNAELLGELDVSLAALSGDPSISCAMSGC